MSISVLSEFASWVDSLIHIFKISVGGVCVRGASTIRRHEPVGKLPLVRSLSVLNSARVVLYLYPGIKKFSSLPRSLPKSEEFQYCEAVLRARAIVAFKK